ncbi:hypothetical protein [Niallia taxi]|uniref:hypothetical protein n=1 Tax=Niallia taxi TaxID=2499688 RepID=UPI003D26EF3B
MKKIVMWLINILYSVPVCGSMWENWNRIYDGFKSQEVTLKDPITALSFVIDDWAWVWLGIYALSVLLVWVIPQLISIVKAWYAKQLKKKREKQKQLIREVIKELNKDN